MLLKKILTVPELSAHQKYSELPGRDALAPGSTIQPPVLFPLEVMVHPLELRFKYHFNGDKPTNRLDKVSHFLYSVSLEHTRVLMHL
jgi:hypothetical protein